MPADGRELLAQFASTGRQEPFEEIVRRYGGMVFNLCYEVTGNRHDAEDAVQAAFLSLAVQTRSGTPVQAIGPWLQQVARRMSLDINRSRRRRKNREAIHGESWENRLTDARADGSGGAGAHGNPSSAAGWEELRGVVQEELNTLPPKYRMPLIMHYYGGLSRDDMARELNCKPNTLGVRLHRGREMLSKRLSKRGVTISGVILGVLMAEVVHSIVTDRLVHSTAQAAVLLSSGHPYACGMVSPQIVAMAQSGARALANAKIKFAAALALLAGGAAAAGAQVVSHVGPWSMPSVSNWDLNRAFRWLFHPPAIPSASTQSAPDSRVATNPKASPDHETIVNVTPPGPSQSPQIHVPQHFEWRGLVPYPTRLSDPGYAQQRYSYPPYPNNPQYGGPLPLPPLKNLPAANETAVAGGSGGGGGVRNGSGGGSDNASAQPQQQDVNKGNAPGDPSKKSEVAGNGQKPGRPSDDSNNNGSQVPPGRGGVKPRSSDVATDGSAKPKAFTPDGIAKDTPVPPRLDYNPGPGKPPILGPGTPAPYHPNPDAEQIGQPPAPTDGSGLPSGGYQSGDVLHISSDYNPDGAPTFEQIEAQGIGNAYFEMGAGQVASNHEVIVGHLGTGVANQTGGVHTLDSLYLGVIKTGHGKYALTGGELQFTTSPTGPDAPTHSLEIGGAGEGLFLLGNADSTGRITQVGETGGAVDLTVAALRTATGTLRGWGTVELTGRLSNNGQVVADGYGQDRSLDLSSFSAVGNDYTNRGGAKGWYAVNHGRLDLPAIAVSAGTNTYTWGGSADDEKITLVNSARMTFNEVQGDAVVKIALLALDRSDTPAFPTDHHLVGMWSFDPGDLTASGGMDLLVRYDDALAAEKGLDENVLKLWKFDGQWERLDFDPTFVRDPANHTLFVHTDTTGMSYFAVSAPEPGALGLVSVGLCLLGLGRRRSRLS
jgi:RNA polymerase sigma factor (sigma-70 family)